MKTRAALAIAMLSATAATLQNDARAQGGDAAAYPDKPVKLVINFAVGGAIDVVGRVVGARLAETLRQPFVIENRPGAGGNIGAEAVAKSRPDGYTLLVTLDTTLTVNPTLYGKLPFDPAKDFVPITLAAAGPLVFLVNPSLPVKTLRELVDLAKAKPRSLTFGSPGNGTAGHLAAATLAQTAGFDFVTVLYKSGPQAATDVAGGQLDFTVLSFTIGPMIQANKLRALAVTSARRVAQYPDVPTVAESGYPGFEAVFWIGFLAPAGTPKPIVARLNGEIVKALQQPSVRDALAGQTMETVGSSPDEFAAIIERDAARWSKVVKASGARVE